MSPALSAAPLSFFLPVLLPLLLLGSSGCIGPASSGSEVPRQAIASPVPSGEVRLDPAMSVEESSRVSADLGRIREFPVQGREIRYFDSVFGGVEAGDVYRYLTERIRWVVSSKTDVEESLTVIEQRASRGDAEVVATNIGSAIWFFSLAKDIALAGLKLGGEVVPVSSSRSGLIQLGKGYSVNDELAALRMATLIHEARHSDCTGGVHLSDLRLIEDGKEPRSRSCGHMHVDCPVGHPYAGLPACDGHPWGAYAVESIYTAALARACPDCPQADQKAALAVFADAASRILNLEPMLKGELGPPDMSSSDEVKP